jgi:hypothetical protein
MGDVFIVRIIAIGNCASYGGLPAAWSNPTGAKGVESALGSQIANIPVVNLPGRTPNSINFVDSAQRQGSLLLWKMPASAIISDSHIAGSLTVPEDRFSNYKLMRLSLITS